MPATAPQNKTLKTKPLILARVRCAADAHISKSPWLQRLYVLWAPVDPTKPPSDPKSDPPKFHLGQTDAEGYLSPLKTDLDPDPQKTVPLAEDTEYLFYFVRHPDDALPREIMADVNKGDTKTWGEAHKLKVARDAPPAGKTKKGKPNKELILKIPEAPASFLPLGSKFYEQWVLFRDMPCAQCDPVLKQVSRLQYHLGAMRYPIGNHGHPYAPELLTAKGAKFKTSNPGQFDVALWNGVLAFQRNLAEGSANQISSKLIEGSLTSGSFDPVSDIAKQEKQLNLSMDYGPTADDEAVKVAAIETQYPTVVDLETGDAIKSWLTKAYRKPGPVLLSPQTIDTYMNSAMLRKFDEWDQALKELGFDPGIKVGNIFREPRIGVVTGGGGVSTSLHKSGFAMDLSFFADKGALEWGDPLPSYPLHFSRDPTVKKAQNAVWIVYAEVPISKIKSYMVQTKNAAGEVVQWKSPMADGKPVDGSGRPAPPAIYHRTIEPWKFDPYHREGGKSLGTLTIPGKAFLEFTTLAKHFGFTNIGAHRGDYLWKYREPLTLKLDATTLGSAVARFMVHLDSQRDPDLKAATTLGIAGEETPFSAFKGEMAFLGKWATVMARYAPGPDLHCEPHTKEGQALIKTLRGNVKTFKGRKFYMVRGVPWDPPELELELTAKTEFPTTPFLIRPITSPVAVKEGDMIEFPEYLGNAGHLEWWHFQYVQGYKDGDTPKKWKNLLGSIGWTEEGLLGPKGSKYIYGHWGVGYSPNDLSKDAS